MMKRPFLSLLAVGCLFVANAQTLTDSLKVHLRFYGNVNDTSGNGNHGTNNGAVPYIGTCTFDGGDYITLPATDIFNAEYTYSLWFQLTATLNSNTKMVLLGVGGSQCDQSLNITKDYFGYNGISAGGYYSAGNTYNANRPDAPMEQWWYHVVGVKTADSMFLYIDGQKVQATATPGQSPCYSGSDPKGVVGAGVGLNQNFTGNIGDLRIYNRALSPGEVTAIFNMNITSYKPAGEVAYSVYPNPSGRGEVFIATEAEVREVRIFDITGKHVPATFNAETGAIALNDMAPGTYFLVAGTNQGVIREKLIIH